MEGEHLDIASFFFFWNTLIQKAWAYKFPFLAEHCECIPVNQRVNAWRNRINNSENVRYFTDIDPNVFEWDPNIGEDIRNLLFPDK